MKVTYSAWMALILQLLHCQQLQNAALQCHVLASNLYSDTHASEAILTVDSQQGPKTTNQIKHKPMANTVWIFKYVALNNNVWYS